VGVGRPSPPGLAGLLSKLGQPIHVESPLDERKEVGGFIRVVVMYDASELLDQVYDTIRLVLMHISWPDPLGELVQPSQQIELPAAGFVEPMKMSRPSRELTKERPEHFFPNGDEVAELLD